LLTVNYPSYPFHSSKLYDYFNKMNVYELNRFCKFIQSPYFNLDERLMQLTQTLLPCFKSSTQYKADEKTIWKRISKSKFNRIKFNRLFSDLVKKAEQFLVIEKLQQKPAAYDSHLLQLMNERKLDKHFPEALTVAIKKHQLHEMRDSHFYFGQFQLEAQHNLFLENKNLRTSDKNIHEAINALDAFYLINKLQYCAALLHYKNFLTIETDVLLLSEILSLLKQKSFTHIPAVDIYHHILLTMLEPEKEKHFEKLKSLLVLHQSLFKHDELKNMFLFAMNYCIRNINLGKTEYLRELFLLYKQSLENDLMLEDGYISPWDYKNIITVGLRLKEFKWTERFINGYKNQIEKKYRSNAYTFNLAKYYFALNQYDKVLPLLQDVKYEDIFYQLDSKTTLMKIFYEQSEYSALSSLKESFLTLVRRKKVISEQNRVNYKNFIRWVIKLSRAEVRDKKEMKRLRSEIESATNVADKGWIKEKVDELI